MAKADILVSVIAVVRNDFSILSAFVEETSAILDREYTNYEILLIDNGSTDGTLKVVHQLTARLKCIRCLRLTRPTDDETAMTAGLDAAIGDYVITMTPDFDSPGEIIPMVEVCRLGSDLVLGVDRHPPRVGLLYGALRRAFLTLGWWLAGIDIVSGATGFRCISRTGVNALVKVRRRRRFFAVLIADVGLTTATHQYDRISRSGGRPRRSLMWAGRTGLSVLVHNSLTPLRVASALGLLGSVLSLTYSAYAVVVYFSKSDVMPGWTTLSLAMSGLFAMAFLILALMGEYMGRLLEESLDRPLYHVRDEQSSAVMLTDTGRRNVLDRSEG